MTQVCLLGKADVNLRYELLSRETARQALATYDLREPFENAVAVETVSLGAAVSLLNDLNWYLVRFADEVFVRDPSISDDEWLSRDLATAIRDDEVDGEENGRFLAIFGLESAGSSDAEASVQTDDAEVSGRSDDAEGSVQSDDAEPPAETDAPDGPTEADTLDSSADPPRLVEPMLVTRTGETVPDYDLRDVEETVVVRLTKSEFGA